MAAKSLKLEFDPPLPLATLKSYAEEIFTPIKRGECVTTVWPVMSGRRVRNKFIITYPQLFEKETGGLDKYLLVYVEPLELEEQSHEGYIRLIIKSIIEAYKVQTGETLQHKLNLDSISYSDSLSNLSDLINIISSKKLKLQGLKPSDSSSRASSERKSAESIIVDTNTSLHPRFENLGSCEGGLEIVLFIGEFDELNFADQVFDNNLKSLWCKSLGKLYFVFLVLEDVTQQENLQKFGELNELILTNIVYVPLSNEQDAEYIIDRLEKEFNRKYTTEEKSLLKETCGGHPYLLRSCCRLIALMNGQKIELGELRDTLIAHFEPRSACQKIFDSLTTSQKDFIRILVSNPSSIVPDEAKVLEKLGLIKQIKTGIKVPFCELFRSVIEKGSSTNLTSAKINGPITFELKSGSIFLGEANVEDKFTRQEYEILRFLLSDSEKLRSRDEIGEAMWGKRSYEKYSDWAIDQVMSKIRKKLKTFGAEKTLVTVRGRGYKINLS